MNAHTPGPWDAGGSFLTNDGQKAIMTVGDDRVRVALVDRHAVAKRGQGYLIECPVRNANARLIAAAPDLLDACDMSINTLLGCCVAGGGVDDRSTMLATIAQLRSAIAKALGK